MYKMANRVKFLRIEHNTVNDKNKFLTLETENIWGRVWSILINEIINKGKFVGDKHGVGYSSKVKTPTCGKTTFCKV